MGNSELIQDNSAYTLSSQLLLKVMKKVKKIVVQDSRTKKKRQMTCTVIAGLAWCTVYIYIICESHLLWSRGDEINL